MPKHDDFIDEYIEYRIFEDSLIGAGKKYPSGKPTSLPSFRLTKPSSNLGCGGWIALICLAIAAISIFGSCSKSGSKSYSSSRSCYRSSRRSYYSTGNSSPSSKSDTSKLSTGFNTGNSTSKSSSSDPYDAKSYAHPEDLYHDYPDDFWNYKDAEDYWDEQFGK